MIKIEINGLELPDDATMLVDCNEGEIKYWVNDGEEHVVSGLDNRVSVYKTSINGIDKKDDLEKLSIRYEKLKSNYVGLCKSILKGYEKERLEEEGKC